MHCWSNFNDGKMERYTRGRPWDIGQSCLHSPERGCNLPTRAFWHWNTDHSRLHGKKFWTGLLLRLKMFPFSRILLYSWFAGHERTWHVLKLSFQILLLNWGHDSEAQHVIFVKKKSANWTSMTWCTTGQALVWHNFGGHSSHWKRKAYQKWSEPKNKNKTTVNNTLETTSSIMGRMWLCVNKITQQSA